MNMRGRRDDMRDARRPATISDCGLRIADCGLRIDCSIRGGHRALDRRREGAGIAGDADEPPG